MAVEIHTNGGHGESVRLSGADAERFVRDVERPSDDTRRLNHLKRSDEAFERLVSSEPISEFETNE
jgi:hypothetical protein